MNHDETTTMTTSASARQRTLAVDATSTFWQPTLKANCCSTRDIALPTPCRRHSCACKSERWRTQSKGIACQNVIPIIIDM